MIETLVDVERTIAEIAAYQREIRSITDEAQAKIDEIKTAAEKEAEGIKALVELREREMSAWAAANREYLFGKNRTISLACGDVGFRISTRIRPIKKHTWGRILGLLEEAGLTQGISVKKSVDKEELHKWPDETLAKVGVQRETVDAFWYEIREDIPTA